MNTQNNLSSLKELSSEEIECVSGAGLVTNLLGTVGSLLGVQEPLTQVGSALNETLTTTVDSLGLGALDGVLNTLI